uniref:hypothetical protein n=1 Tax=Pseudomonas sp. TaxID=306 RepID=UPI00272CA04E
MQTFQIVFQGQVRPGYTLEQARTRLGQLFQAPERQLDVLFSGARVVIKQGLDQDSAAKYREAIERAGALCLVEPMQAAVGGSEQAAAPAQAVQAASGRPRLRVQPRDAYMAAFADVDAPDLDVAPLGSDLQEEYADFVPLPIDLSA